MSYRDGRHNPADDERRAHQRRIDELTKELRRWRAAHTVNRLVQEYRESCGMLSDAFDYPYQMRPANIATILDSVVALANLIHSLAVQYDLSFDELGYSPIIRS